MGKAILLFRYFTISLFSPIFAKITIHEFAITVSFHKPEI